MLRASVTRLWFCTTHDLIESRLTSSLHASESRIVSHLASAGDSAARERRAQSTGASDTDSVADSEIEATALAVVDLSTPNDICWQPVRIKFDSGSDFNLVSREVLDDMEFDGPYEESKPIAAMTIGGVAYNLSRRVKIHWHLRKSLKMRRTRFYVVDKTPFDLLVGKEVTTDHDLLHHDRNFLPQLRTPGRSKKERERTAQRTKNKDEQASAADNQTLPVPTNPGLAHPVAAAALTTAVSTSTSQASLGP